MSYKLRSSKSSTSPAIARRTRSSSSLLSTNLMAAKVLKAKKNVKIPGDASSSAASSTSTLSSSSFPSVPPPTSLGVPATSTVMPSTLFPPHTQVAATRQSLSNASSSNSPDDSILPSASSSSSSATSSSASLLSAPATSTSSSSFNVPSSSITPTVSFSSASTKVPSSSSSSFQPWNDDYQLFHTVDEADDEENKEEHATDHLDPHYASSSSVSSSSSTSAPVQHLHHAKFSDYDDEINNEKWKKKMLEREQMYQKQIERIQEFYDAKMRSMMQSVSKMAEEHVRVMEKATSSIGAKASFASPVGMSSAPAYSSPSVPVVAAPHPTSSTPIASVPRLSPATPTTSVPITAKIENTDSRNHSGSQKQERTDENNADFSQKVFFSTPAKKEIARKSSGDGGDDDDGDDDGDDDDPQGNVISFTKEHTNPFQYFIPYFILREKLYSIHKHSNAQLYQKRFTLCTEKGRRLEHWRFGYCVNFDSRLYSPMFLRRLNNIRDELNLPLIGSTRPTRVTDALLPKMIMTYDHKEYVDCGGDGVNDIDLPENSVTLASLPALLRQHPVSSSSVPDLSFENFMKMLLKTEVEQQQQKVNAQLAAVKLARLSGTTMPKSEPVNYSSSSAAAASAPVFATSTATTIVPKSIMDEYANQQVVKNKTAAEVQASSNSVLGDVLDFLPVDMRAQAVALIQQSDIGEHNRFADKQLLKKAPAPDEKFKGEGLGAGKIMQWIVLQIAQYNFNVGEAMVMLNNCFDDRAATWYAGIRSTLSTLPAEEKLITFFNLFRQEFLSPSHINEIQSRIQQLALTSLTTRAVDGHWKIFSDLTTTLRLCKQVSEAEVINWYFNSIGVEGRRRVTVAEYDRATKVHRIYTLLRTDVSFTSVHSHGGRPVRVEMHGMQKNAGERFEEKRRRKHRTPSSTNSQQSTSQSQQNNKNTQQQQQQQSRFDKSDKRFQICFHCGDKGHLAVPTECPALAANRPQNAAGKIAWANYCAKTGLDKEYVPRKSRAAGADNSDSSSGGEPSSSTSYSSAYRGSQKKNNDGTPNTLTKPSSPHTSAMHTITTTVADTDDDDADPSAVEVLINKIIVNNLFTMKENDLRRLIYDEQQQAHLQLATIIVGGKNVEAMVDSGCTNVIARDSYVIHQWPEAVHHPIPRGSHVKSSSGEKIPMRYLIKENIVIGGYMVKDALIYVVDDSGAQDICADFVVGRSLLAKIDAWISMANDQLTVGKNGEVVKLIPAHCIMKQCGQRVKSIVTPLKNNPDEAVPAVNALLSRSASDTASSASSLQSSLIAGNTSVIEKSDEIELSVIPSSNDAKNDVDKHGQSLGSQTHRQRILQRRVKQDIKQKEKEKHIMAVEQAICAKLSVDTSLTDDMKELIHDNVVKYAMDYGFVSRDGHAQLMELAMFLSDDDNDTENECRERLMAYMHAYNAVVKENGSKSEQEQNYLIKQLVSLPLSTGEPTEEELGDDEAMKNVESIDDLGPTPRIPDTPTLQQERKDAIIKMVNATNDMNDDQKKKMIKLLTGDVWMKVISLKGENFTQTASAQHEINTLPGAQPFKQKLRLYSLPLQQIINAEVERMIKEGIIVPSTSPYASNLLLVRKPDPSSEGGVKNRVCVNFIQLNKQTIKDSYPMANANVMFNEVARGKWFSTCDLLSGYWQVLVKPEHRHKTAFITQRGLYEFVVMAFGLCNAPGTFQRLMDEVISPQYREFIQTFVDDLIVFSPTFEKHLEHLLVLGGVLKKHRLTVKLTKCRFGRLEVKHLGHLLSHGKIKPNPEKVKAIQEMVRPKNIKGVRSFVCSVNWYRRFIPKFAEIAAPLFNLTKKNAEFIWDDKCQNAFDQLKQALISEPVLIAADPNKDFIAQSDASESAISMALLQEDDKQELHPVAYASKTLCAAQRNYDVSQRECLAMVWGLEHFNLYLEGHRYTCLTDHNALTYLINNKDSKNQRLTRWILRLQPYHLKIAYLKGTHNPVADMLSRKEELMEVNPSCNAVMVSLNEFNEKELAYGVYFNAKRAVVRKPKNRDIELVLLLTVVSMRWIQLSISE